MVSLFTPKPISSMQSVENHNEMTLVERKINRSRNRRIKSKSINLKTLKASAITRIKLSLFKLGCG